MRHFCWEASSVIADLEDVVVLPPHLYRATARLGVAYAIREYFDANAIRRHFHCCRQRIHRNRSLKATYKPPWV
ncbi:MAG: hypothetical protein NVS4B11_13200 [Ktedonobacteraceae bacterium]